MNLKVDGGNPLPSSLKFRTLNDGKTIDGGRIGLRQLGMVILFWNLELERIAGSRPIIK